MSLHKDIEKEEAFKAELTGHFLADEYYNTKMKKQIDGLSEPARMAVFHIIKAYRNAVRLLAVANENPKELKKIFKIASECASYGIKEAKKFNDERKRAKKAGKARRKDKLASRKSIRSQQASVQV